MSRALIPNSTQIPDIIFDHWMAKLSGAELKVLLYIARRTYGFGKESDNISLTQIAEGITRKDGSVLDCGTGISRPTIVRALKALCDRGIVVRQTNLSETGREFEENTYRINLVWEVPEGGTPQPGNGPSPGNEAGSGEGGGYKMQPPPSRKSRGVGSKFNHPVSKVNQGWSQNVTTVVKKFNPQETDLQETDQETAAAEAGSTPEETALPDAAAVLTEDLVSHGVGREVAEDLARTKPAVCRRCLAYLPYAKIRTTKGAWLANAIRSEYGPPEGYVKSQAKASQASAARSSTANACRTKQERRRAAKKKELWSSYRQLEKTTPEALTAFGAYLASERARAERFATKLSLERQAEYLASLDTEEHRLALFGRWLEAEGKGFTGDSSCAVASVFLPPRGAVAPRR